MGVYRTEAQVQDLRAEVEQARSVNAALQERVDALATDPQEIEREARNRLGLVKEGDRVYLLPDSPSDEAPVDAAASDPEADPGPSRRP